MYKFCITLSFYTDKAAAIKMQIDLKILSYVDSDYKPSSWLAFMMTSKPAGKDGLLTRY
jgi:hypothetical protein